jgi:hypothetical protein
MQDLQRGYYHFREYSRVALPLLTAANNMRQEMTANSERGEVAIMLGGRECVLRPTMEAVARIENALDSGLMEIYQKLRKGNYGLRDAHPIIREGLRAAEEKIPDNLPDIIYVDGVLTFYEPISAFIVNALNGGKVVAKKQDDDPGEAKAGT